MQLVYLLDVDAHGSGDYHFLLLLFRCLRSWRVRLDAGE